MGNPPHVASVFAHQRMDAAAQLVKTIDQARRQQAEQDRQSYERFYSNLALISGGTIALSVTFLGYLKSLPKVVIIQDEKSLVASWLCLLLCIGTSLSYILFNTHYGFYFMNKAYFEALQKR